jgi:hypothetical protein
MNCYVCATEDVLTVAVATCPVCGVGLSLLGWLQSPCRQVMVSLHCRRSGGG